MKRILIVGLLCLGCVNPQVEAKRKYEESLFAWGGKDINEYIRAKGAPTGQFVMPNGNTVFSWARRDARMVTRMVYGQTVTRDRSDTCTVQVEAAPNGVISNLKYEGNDCY